MVLDILDVGMEGQSFVCSKMLSKCIFFWFRAMSEADTCCLCCVDWICMIVWVERPFMFGNLANVYDQQVSAVEAWNQEAFN